VAAIVSIGVWDGLAVMLKAVLYAATLGAAGGVFFLSYAGSMLDQVDGLAARRLVQILVAASLIASVTRIFVTAGSMSGDASGTLDADLVGMIWRAGEGRAITVRAAGLLLALPAVLRHRRPGVLTLAGAAGAATSFAWVGHAHTTASGWPILLIGIHLLAVAFWLGALGPLLLLARHNVPRRIASVAARFGTAAAAVVAALILAGLAVLGVLLNSASELWASGYGRTLCVKLALVACLLACAAFNKLRLTPRLMADHADAVRTLRASIRIELVLVSLILIVTAALTTLTGPPTAE
jgi:copper resistance protein D